MGIKEGLPADHLDPRDELSEESSVEQVTPKHKAPLSYKSTTSMSPSLEIKPKYRVTTSSSSRHTKFSTHPDIKLGQSRETLLSPHSSTATCEIDPFSSDEDSVSSDDSIF